MSGDTSRDEPGEDTVSAGDPSSDRLELTNLVKQYFNICNAALVHGVKGPVDKALSALMNEYAGGTTVTLEVTGSADGPPVHYTTRFVEGQFTPIRAGEYEPDVRFSLERDFLAQVERDAATYIEHPERLDWGWMRGSGRDA